MSNTTFSTSEKQARVTVSEFGRTPEGKTVHMYTLRNAQGMIAKIMTYGASLTELHVPGRNGQLTNVVLGFDSLEPYLGDHAYMGATVGRYANRIARGRFVLDGKEYQLELNHGEHTLHGGRRGFDRRLWDASACSESDSAQVQLRYLSPDAEEGFPGNLEVQVTYTLTDGNELRMDYLAKSDQRTPVNMTNHSYFNLAGAGSGNVLDHVLTINADRYTPVDEHLIPTGSLAPVAGTPLDFRQPVAVGARIEETPGGYDNNFVINKEPGTLAFAARVEHPGSGRMMEVYTTQPGVQLYTGNHLDGSLGGNGGCYHRFAALCLETQHFPDSVHHESFPDVILAPGGQYKHTIIYRFYVQ